MTCGTVPPGPGVTAEQTCILVQRASIRVFGREALCGGTADLVQWTLTDHLNTVRDIAVRPAGA